MKRSRHLPGGCPQPQRAVVFLAAPQFEDSSSDRTKITLLMREGFTIAPATAALLNQKATATQKLATFER